MTADEPYENPTPVTPTSPDFIPGFKQDRFSKAKSSPTPTPTSPPLPPTPIAPSTTPTPISHSSSIPSLEAQHKALVEHTCKTGDAILHDISPKQAHLLHMAVGICGEAGELLDQIKKHTIYQRPLDTTNVVEELGDLEYYMHGIRMALGIPRSETLNHNIDKLYTRYAQGYSNSAAQARADKLNEELCESEPPDSSELCDKCSSEPALPLHTCPLLAEVYGNEEELCNCCETCQIACYDAI